MQDKLYLGIDAGGTRCRARLADENLNTLAEHQGGAANINLEGGEPAYRAILELVPPLLDKAGLGEDAAGRIYAGFGMAGAHLPSAKEEFAARDYPFAGVIVYNDVETARAGAHEGADGAVLIMGTGSSGLAQVDGKLLPVAGWGYHISDLASGAILGRELARYAVLAQDDLVPGSPLTRAVIDHLGGSCETAMDWSFNAWPKDFASLVPMIFDYLERNDPIAFEMITMQLKSVDVFANWFRVRGVKKLCTVGGLGERLHPVLDERYGNDFMARPKADAQHGALLLARARFSDN